MCSAVKTIFKQSTPVLFSSERETRRLEAAQFRKFFAEEVHADRLRNASGDCS
jgi:hypothetical protein